MLIYGTRLWFTPEVGLDAPLLVVARWLSSKTGKSLSPGPFLTGVDRSFEGGQQIRSMAGVAQFPKLLAVEYSHPDSSVAGRQWVTELGLRQEQATADVECTVLLQTSEISTRVAAAVQPSRPGLVSELVRRCSLSSRTQGISIRTLGDEDAEGFRHWAFDRGRQVSMIVLSPDSDGKYIAEPERLSSLLLGLAGIVVIPPEADTFWLARAVGRELIPYRGAAKLVYPMVRDPARQIVPSRLMTVDEAAKLRAQGVDPATELFSLVLHRSNLPLSWNHISMARVREAKLGHELAVRRAQVATTGEQRDYIAWLEEQGARLEAELEDSKVTANHLEKVIVAQEDRERLWDFERESLIQRLAEAGSGASRGDEISADRQDIAQAVLHGVAKGPTPEESLLLVEHLFPDRIAVLPTAWQSARESVAFANQQKLYGLLNALATDYWQSLVNGGTDGEARKVFGNAYAATESERVAKNSGARERRTFEYRGRPIEMMKHLKIGRKDSVAETIRVHFEWFADEQRIVIGYCGPHIPFK